MMSSRVEDAKKLLVKIATTIAHWIRNKPSIALILVGLFLAAATPWQGASILIPAFIFILTGVALFITSQIFYQSSETSENYLPARQERRDLEMLLSKLLTDEEARVVEVLIESDGTILQREIPYRTGMSKLKVHRIITRLADRGLLIKKKENGKVIVMMDSEVLKFLKEAGQSLNK